MVLVLRWTLVGDGVYSEQFKVIMHVKHTAYYNVINYLIYKTSLF